MFTEGRLLYFDPFYFKNGNMSKPKYFIVLGHLDNEIIMASLPTSKDHLPENVLQQRGCVNIPDSVINVYIFNTDDEVTENFKFKVPTFVYGEQVDEYSKDYIIGMQSKVKDLGILKEPIFMELKSCLRQSIHLKKRYKKHL